MTIYKEKSNSVGKVLLALVIFVLGMTLTVAEVSGVNYSTKNPADVTVEPATSDAQKSPTDPGTKPYDPNTSADTENSYAGETFQTVDPELVLEKSPVPEPATMILISGGLGLLYFQRRRQNKKH